MKSIKFFIALALMLVSVPIFALAQEGTVDPSNAGSLVAYLTPFIVLAATWLFKVVAPVIPSWATLIVVTALSALLTYLTNLLTDPGLAYWAQFGLGLASTFVHQFYMKLTAPKPTA